MIEAIKLSQMKTDFWRNAINNKKKPVIEYNEDADILDLYFTDPIDKPGPIVAHYLDQNVSLLFRNSDLEIVGFGIEGFSRSFASNYSVSNPWRLSKTDAKLDGITEVILCIKVEDRADLNIPVRIQKEIKFEPEYAFA